jgi:hypothetical protein
VLGVGSLFYQVINNMYKTSRSCVRLQIQSGITDFFSVHLGVKQGDNLNPNLFKIFINDLPSYLDKSLDPVYLDEKPIHCLMYADDIVLLSSTPQVLQTKLNSLVLVPIFGLCDKKSFCNLKYAFKLFLYNSL